MFTSSFLKTAKTTKYFSDDPFKLSHTWQSKKYHTPYKSYGSTNPTKNATISLYSFTSKKKTAPLKKNPKPKNNNNKDIKIQSKAKSVDFRKQYHQKEKKKSLKHKKAQVKFKQPVQQTKVFLSNTSFYRSSRASLDSKSNIEWMSKISKIFDLVTLHSQLPEDIELFLRHPLHALRGSLKRSSRNQIAKILLKFKNDCSEIFQNAPASDVCSFLRTPLPDSNRWSSSKYDSFTKKQNQRYMRQKYFQSLKRKSAIEKSYEDQRLTNLENRLNQFWEKSIKARKVFI